MGKHTKQINALRKAAADQGWTEKPIRAGWMLLSPDGVTKVTIHKTPGDRWYANTIGEMRRGGFKD